MQCQCFFVLRERQEFNRVQCACHDVDSDADGRDRVFSGLHYVSSLFREAGAGRVARGVSEERAEGPGHTDMWDQKPEGGIRINGINGKKS